MKQLIVILLSFSFLQFLSQEYNYQYITQAQGLNNTFINGIVQDDRGYLFISTGEGIGVYNGVGVEMYYKKNKIVDDYVSASYKDKNGNLWFGHIQGGSSIFYENKFAHVFIGAGIGSQINDIAEDKDGRIWFVSQEYGLYYFTENNDKDFFPKPSSNRLYYSLFINEADDFFLGTDKGIEVYNFTIETDGGHLNKTQNIGIEEEEQIASIIDINGTTTFAISLHGSAYTIIKKNGSYSAEKLSFYNLNTEIVVTEAYSSKGYLWISTLQNGLLKCSIQDNQIFIKEKYNKNSGLKTDAVNTSFVDREGVLWIGTFGEGLASKEEDLFTYYFIDKKNNNPLSSVLVNKTNLFVAGKSKIEHFDKQNVTLYKTYTSENGIPKDEITDLLFDKDSNLYISTTLNGVYVLKKGEEHFEKIHISEDNLSQTISDIEIVDNWLYIATLNGAYRYNLNSGGVNIFNITTGLPHNAIGCIYKTSDNRLIIGTNSAFISELKDEVIINYPIKDGLEVIEVNDIFEDHNGEIWFTSNGSGLFKLQDNQCFNLNTDDGLISNYCNALRINKLGNIWVSHNEGLSNINIKDSTIQTYDQYFGLNHRFLRGSMTMLDNEIWFGTENGLVLYNSDKDFKNKVPPITTLKFVSINDSLYKIDEEIHLNYGSYKFGFGIAGLTLKGAKKVKYSFILEGYDDKWSEKTDKNTIFYTRMNEGEYIFRVKSYNADGTEGTEASIKIIVKKPYWQTWWFYVICFIGIVAVVFIIVKFRERSFIRYQEKLKRDLALRTREVVEQKNKIEAINKDITDSINYAQRIQRSILPQDQYIEKLFPNYFIFFRPRDIVSGDFYWCGEMGDKQLIVCADCTGHGVPGGFMSMISHILLREALTEETLNNPALILQQINSKIVEVLKQTDDIDSNRDGLDIAIIVQDKKNMKVKFAGAMRPLYIYRKGVRTVIKGDRNSLGGLQNGKQFETKEADVQPGDKLYIFSDGYADQFGGPRKSKMKINVFQEVLDQVSQLEMPQQKEAIADFFYKWKQDMSQMDDVLVIGIEI